VFCRRVCPSVRFLLAIDRVACHYLWLLITTLISSNLSYVKFQIFDGLTLLTLQKHTSSPPVYSGVRVTRSLVLYVVFCRSVCPCVLFLLTIVLFNFLRFTASDYLFGIFKLFFVLPSFILSYHMMMSICSSQYLICISYLVLLNPHVNTMHITSL
jgi:hypothetical protein